MVDMGTTLHSPYGVFDPLIYLVGLMFALFLVWIIWRGLGYSGYKKRTDQTKPFLCGHDEPSKDAMHIPAGSMYWGFFAALSGYFEFLRKEHSGFPCDYAAWFVLTASVIGIALLAWGV